MRTPALWLAGALLAGPLAAQSPTFGLQASLTLPRGQVTTSTNWDPGFGFGCHVGWEGAEGNRLRVRLDRVAIKGSTQLQVVAFAPVKHFQAGSLKGPTTSLRSWTAGAEYAWFPKGNSRAGGFLSLGAGVSRVERKTLLPSPDPEAATTFAWALGAGWQLPTHMGAEMRFTSARPTFGGELLEVETLQVAMTFRF